MINKHTRINFTIIIVQFFLGSRGPNAEGARETAKGKLLSEKKGLWPRPLRISLPCSYQVQILNLVSDWLRPWTSDLIGSLYQTGLTSHGRSQSKTFKIWTWYEHGSEILNGRGQRPFSSLRSFPFAVSPALSALGPLEPESPICNLSFYRLFHENLLNCSHLNH